MQHKLGKRDPSARIAPLLFRPADVATARAREGGRASGGSPDLVAGVPLGCAQTHPIRTGNHPRQRMRHKKTPGSLVDFLRGSVLP
jgi:hypothetical protein